MKKLFYLSLTGILITFILVSCNKNSSSPTSTTSGASDGFFYAENGSTTQTKMDKADVYATYKTINANSGSGTGMKICEINLSGLSAGTYSISSSNAFTFVVSGSTTWIATSGSVIITSNSSGKLTGTFDVQGSGTGTSVNRYSGSFTNIAIQ
ncbi:MAG: hypothetical protein JSR09_04880 [Bacteroidetes bacterium]|nr:hypothetical protein [Bacteroidota bacterium]MBS1649021.1 hypothetical protein [Bacteroidota bacterium]